MHLVDVGMLIGKTVARVVPYELDVAGQTVFRANDSIGFRTHLGAMINRIKPFVRADHSARGFKLPIFIHCGNVTH